MSKQTQQVYYAKQGRAYLHMQYRPFYSVYTCMTSTQSGPTASRLPYPPYSPHHEGGGGTYPGAPSSFNQWRPCPYCNAEKCLTVSFFLGHVKKIIINIFLLRESIHTRLNIFCDIFSLSRGFFLQVSTSNYQDKQVLQLYLFNFKYFL